MLSLISRDWGLGPVSVITVTLVWVGDLGGRCTAPLSLFIILRRFSGPGQMTSVEIC